LIAVAGLLVVAASLAVAEPSRKSPPAGQPEFKLPPGWTAADMQACMVAGTPGKMHEYLAKGVGVWHGKQSMWMAPGAEPVTNETVSTVTPWMDGRFVKCEMSGEIPGMGPYTGFGAYGFDNAAGKFVSVWVDNHSTGIMNGVGELSEDGKMLSWKYTFHCPITQKPAVMRDVETVTGPNTKTIEMFSVDPKSGKEYRMMRIELTRKSAQARAK
jgi:hypothetical protein